MTWAETLWDTGIPQPSENPLHYVWDWFTSVYPFGGCGMGPMLLSYAEIEAFERRMGTRFRDYEVELLRDLSRTFMAVYARKQKEKSERPKGFRDVKGVDGIKAMFLAQGHRNAPKPKRKAT